MYDSTDLENGIERIISLITAGRTDEAVTSLRSLAGEMGSALDDMSNELEAVQEELETCRENLEDCREAKEEIESEPSREPVFF